MHVRDFYRSLFNSRNVIHLSLSYTAFRPALTDDELSSLLTGVSLDEVRAAVFSMKGLKAPGTDGIQPIFYQRHWNGRIS